MHWPSNIIGFLCNFFFWYYFSISIERTYNWHYMTFETSKILKKVLKNCKNYYFFLLKTTYNEKFISNECNTECKRKILCTNLQDCKFRGSWGDINSGCMSLIRLLFLVPKCFTFSMIRKFIDCLSFFQYLILSFL